MKRGDLDAMRLRKDELRKLLDAHFTVLGKRVGKLRQEPIGYDRDRNEFYLHGGVSLSGDGELDSCDLARLLIRKPARRGSEEVEEWRCIERPEEVQQLLSSLRPMGERENQLQKALMEVVPRMETAMRKVRGEEEPTVAVKEEEEKEVEGGGGRGGSGGKGKGGG